MPFDGLAQWQIDILAADKTAQAFNSVNRRLDATEKSLGGVSAKLNEQQTLLTALSQRQNQFSLGMASVVRIAGPMAGIFGSLALAQRAWDAGMQSGALIDQATQLGITTDLLQAYRDLAQGAGVDTGQLDGAIQKLNGQMGQAKGGNDEAIDRFDKLGVKLLDSEKKLRGVADVMPEVARGLLKISSESERNAMAQELFGRAGARIVTMLPELAKGNDAVAKAAKEHGSIVERDVLEAWNKLDSQIKKTNKEIDAFLATIGAPIATAALDQIYQVLKSTREEIDAIVKAWQFITRTQPVEKQLAGLNSDIAAFRDRGHDDNSPVMKEMIARRDALQSQLLDKPIELPPVTVTASEGVSQPPKKGDGAAGKKLDERLKELQTERAALERALAAFDTRSTETVAEVDKRLNAQVALEKKIFDVLKDVPPNSPLAAQLTQEATAISQLNLRLDEKKRLLTEAEQVTQQYGDGTREATRKLADLDKMLAMGVVTQQAYQNAVRATNQAQEDQARAARGAAGGFDAFLAGIEQGMADMERANSTFNLGKRSIDMLSDAISDLATGAEVDFNRILLSFANMILQMEMQAMASNIWNAITGKGPTDQGLGGMLGGWLGGLFGGGGGEAAGSIGAGIGDIAGSIGMFAEGGRYAAGQPRIVGEKGWELDIPDRGGTVLNQRQIASMLGGGGGGGALAVHISLDNDLLRALVRDESGQVVATATPHIIGAATDQARKEVMPAMNAYESQRGGEWRDD